MREFKNPKAKKLYLESLELDKLADKIEQEDKETKLINENCRGMSRSLELHWEAMGLRAMADDIEDGIDNGIEIDDEEER